MLSGGRGTQAWKDYSTGRCWAYLYTGAERDGILRVFLLFLLF